MSKFSNIVEQKLEMVTPNVSFFLSYGGILGCNRYICAVELRSTDLKQRSAIAKRTKIKNFPCDQWSVIRNKPITKTSNYVLFTSCHTENQHGRLMLK